MSLLHSEKVQRLKKTKKCNQKSQLLNENEVKKVKITSNIFRNVIEEYTTKLHVVHTYIIVPGSSNVDGDS